nr:vegetative cell wall protein gp1-like [Aegilops tauschii subsp. strangulata]
MPPAAFSPSAAAYHAFVSRSPTNPKTSASIGRAAADPPTTTHGIRRHVDWLSASPCDPSPQPTPSSPPHHPVGPPSTPLHLSPAPCATSGHAPPTGCRLDQGDPRVVKMRPDPCVTCRPTTPAALAQPLGTTPAWASPVQRTTLPSGELAPTLGAGQPASPSPGQR